jgi:hypothetical protein
MIVYSLSIEPLILELPQKRVLEDFVQVHFTTLDLAFKSYNTINNLLIPQKRFRKKYTKVAYKK